MSDPLVYTAMPKWLSGFNPFIGAFVYRNQAIPISPYQYPAWLVDSVDRDRIREGCSRYLEAADELWVFGCVHGAFPMDEEQIIKGIGITDGMTREIEQAEDAGKPIRYAMVDRENQRIGFMDGEGSHPAWWSISNYGTPDHSGRPDEDPTIQTDGGTNGVDIRVKDISVGGSEKFSTGDYENYEPHLNLTAGVEVPGPWDAHREEIIRKTLELQRTVQAVLEVAGRNRIALQDDEDWTLDRVLRRLEGESEVTVQDAEDALEAVRDDRDGGDDGS